MIKKIFSMILVCCLAVSLRVVPYADVYSLDAAKGAVLIDAASGRVIEENNCRSRLPNASTTKIMTAILTLEQPDLDEMFTVDANAIAVEGSSMGLTEGDSVSLRTLAWGMLLSSGNDAANAAAVRIDGSIEKFCERMNKKAAELGMQDTHFSSPSGLENGEHYTTAYDLALLARYALQNDDFAEMVSSKSAKLYYGNPPYHRWLTNHNRLLWQCEDCIGIKTGFTKAAGRCLVSAAERDGLTLIAVTLDAPDDWRDHKAMLDYGFEHYEKRVFYKAGEYSADIPLSDGYKGSAKVVNTAPLVLTVRKDCKDLSLRIEGFSRFLTAPVRSGQPFGQIVIAADGKEISSPLVVAEDLVGKTKIRRSFFQKIADIFR